MKNYFNKKITVFIVFVACVMAVHFFGAHRVVTVENLKNSMHYLSQLVEQYYLASVLVYIMLLIGAVLFFLPVTVILTVAGGFFFGVFYTTLYVLGGVTIGSVLLFLLVRYLCGTMVQKRYKDQLQVFNRELEQYGHHYLLTLQLLPLTPSFIINTLSGLTCISLWTFAWTTFVGIAPGVIIYAYAGRELRSITSINDIISAPLIIVLCALALLSIVPMLYRRRL